MSDNDVFVYADGGRKSAGYKGSAGDCVVRAIAIASGVPYRDVYAALGDRMKTDQKCIKRGKTTPRNGVPRTILRDYLSGIGWRWTPTMFFGSGCKVHLVKSELPTGRIIVSLSKHICAVIDGVIYDTGDPSRRGTRCVYGYWSKPSCNYE